jgi:hypothetical protein
MVARLCPVYFNLLKSGKIFSYENTQDLSEADPTTPEPSRNSTRGRINLYGVYFSSELRCVTGTNVRCP